MARKALPVLCCAEAWTPTVADGAAVAARDGRRRGRAAQRRERGRYRVSNRRPARAKPLRLSNVATGLARRHRWRDSEMDMERSRNQPYRGTEGPGWSVEFQPPNTAPVAIGAIGGSGTRVVARLLERLGYHLGENRNEELDNLHFTFLFKRPDLVLMPDAVLAQRIEIFVRTMTGGVPFTDQERSLILDIPDSPPPDFSVAWFAEQASALLEAPLPPRPARGLWGWKEPNTHVIIDRLIASLPTLKYIHVVRNGLDMAFSPNQNQLKLWGPHFLASENLAVTPRNALRYWRAVHERILALRERLAARLFVLSFDQLCQRPATTLDALLDFLQADPPSRLREQMRALICPPVSIGRFKRENLSTFESSDIDFVRSLGFETDPG